MKFIFKFNGEITDFQCRGGNLVAKGYGMKDKTVIQGNPYQKTNFKGKRQWKELKGFSGMRKARPWLSMGYWWV